MARHTARSRRREPGHSTTVLVVQGERNLVDGVQRELGSVDNLAVERVEADRWVLPGAGADVVVLDVGALVPSGYEIVRVLQSRDTSAPIIILRPTASGVAPPSPVALERITAIESRLHAAVGRSSRRAWLPLRYRGIHLEASLPGLSVHVDGELVRLSAREAELLGLLLAHVNRVVARDVLLGEIWGFETRSLDVHVRRLRQKLGPAGHQIETVPAFGYRFAESRRADAPDGPAGARADLLQPLNLAVVG